MSKKLISFLFALFMLIAFATPVDAARYENITVGNLIVEKSARIDGLLEAVANTTGNVWYVDSGSGVNAVGAAGKSKDRPFDTLDYAIGRCIDNHNDYIIVMAGHAENLAAADAVDVDVAGVTILGLGDGQDRPTFTYTGTGGEFVIGAANVRIANLVFVAGVSNVTMGISVEAAGDNFTMEYCEVTEPGTATYDFADIIDLASGADDITINGMLVRQLGVTAGDLDHFLEMGTGVNNRVRVLNSLIEGEFLVSAIWSDKADTEVLIDNCIITNATNAQHAIEFTSTARGTIRNTLVRTDAQGTACNPGSLTMHNVFWDDNDVADSVAIPVVAGGEATQALIDVSLDHLMALDGATSVYPEQAANDSTICKLMADDDPANCNTYNNATDSLEALGVKQGANNNNNEFASTAVLENVDGSMLERLEGLKVQSDDILAGLRMAGVSIGNVYYVDNATGDSADNGTTWALAEDTIVNGYNNTTDDKGDIVFVAPDHEETLGDAQIALDEAGVRIIGLGDGEQVPMITMTNANSSIDVTATDVTLENIHIYHTTADAAIMIDVDASGFVLKDCKVTGSGAGHVIGLDLATTLSDVTVQGNYVYVTDTDGDAFINATAGAETHLVIRDNDISGDYDLATIYSDQINIDALIMDNVIRNVQTGIHAIELSAATTGDLVGNRLYTDAYATTLDPGSMMCFENYAVDVVDEGAYLIPNMGDHDGNYLGVNSANNDAGTATVVENNDGSVLERLEHLQALSDDILAGLRMAGHDIGNVYYVDDATGDNSDAGTSWALAEADIANGYNNTTDDKGDIVFVAPDHEETLGDAQIALDEAGVMIIGLGSNEQMPMITMSNANSSLDVTATDVTIENIHFYSTTADSTIAIDVDASGFTLRGCRFTESGAGHVRVLDVATALTDITIEDNFSYSTDTDGVAFWEGDAGAQTNVVIRGNRLWGDYDNAVIWSDDADVNILIEDNIIRNVNTGVHAVEFTGAATGYIHGNQLAADTAGSILDPGSCMVYDNEIMLTGTLDANDRGMMVDKWYYCNKTFELDATATYDALFTVTGTVEMKVFGLVTETLTAHGDTVSIGPSDDPALMIAATAGSAPMTNGDAWTSVSPAKGEPSLATSFIVNTDTVGITQSGANLADGTVVIHVYWRPLSNGALVVPL